MSSHPAVRPEPCPETPLPSRTARVWRRMAAALTHRDFRILWIGACTSTIGTWMQKVAQNWLVLSLTGSAVDLGITVGLPFGPVLVFGAWGGPVGQGPVARLLQHHGLERPRAVRRPQLPAGRSAILAYTMPIWSVLVALALFNIALWNGLVLFGLAQLPAGRTAILAYTMPIWSVLISLRLLQEPLSLRKVGGLALGIEGMALLLGEDIPGISGARRWPRC